MLAAQKINFAFPDNESKHGMSPNSSLLGTMIVNFGIQVCMKTSFARQNLSSYTLIMKFSENQH